MASTNLVKVVEVCHITPSSQSPESSIEVSLPLTFFDLLMLKIEAIEVNFFYNVTELTPTMFQSVILPLLKHSLSLTLNHFLPLAGNVTWPPHAATPIILYTPKDGVSMTVAESNNIADFDYLSSNEIHDIFMSRPYVPKLSISDTKASILALQITLFPNKGFSIGYAANHAVLDGKSLIMFMKAWIYMCKHNTSLLPAELNPSFDRTVVQDPEDIGTEYLKIWSSVNLAGFDSNINARSLKPNSYSEAPPSLVQATFAISREDIKRLRERVLSQYEKQRKPIHLSSFVLSYAYTSVCIAKARGLKKDDIIVFAFPGDYRGRLDPPIPTNYFGNCLGFCFARAEGGALIGDNGIAFVAQKLSEMVKQFEKEALEGAKEKLANFLPLIPTSKICFGITGSPGFEVYGIDFGWGPPKNVEFATLHQTDIISMVKSKYGSGGVEIGLVLKKHEMDIFQTLFVEGLQDADRKKISCL